MFAKDLLPPLEKQQNIVLICNASSDLNLQNFTFLLPGVARCENNVGLVGNWSIVLMSEILTSGWIFVVSVVWQISKKGFSLLYLVVDKIYEAVSYV